MFSDLHIVGHLSDFRLSKVIFPASKQRIERARLATRGSIRRSPADQRGLTFKGKSDSQLQTKLFHASDMRTENWRIVRGCLPKKGSVFVFALRKYDQESRNRTLTKNVGVVNELRLDDRLKHFCHCCVIHVIRYVGTVLYFDRNFFDEALVLLNRGLDEVRRENVPVERQEEASRTQREASKLKAFIID